MAHMPANDDRPEPTRPLRVLYCRCAYANVVPEDTKDAVLQKLCEAGASFDSVADLCEMSARRDPALQAIAEEGNVKIAACYERAVRGLFRAADAPIEGRNVQVHNMRTDDAQTIVDALLNDSADDSQASGGGSHVSDDRREEATRESA